MVSPFCSEHLPALFILCSSYCCIGCSLSAHFRTLFIPFAEQSVPLISIWPMNPLPLSAFNTTWIKRHCFFCSDDLKGVRLFIPLSPLHAGRKLFFLCPVLLSRVFHRWATLCHICILLMYLYLNFYHHLLYSRTEGYAGIESPLEKKKKTHKMEPLNPIIKVVLCSQHCLSCYWAWKEI